ncbi:hypothetical protein RCH23_002115 [Cryobacterium sp. CAN_C3]|uniref:hypothetical protein n=1 Tax=unclassified Cryobacterium TaxID=2649013 RepID=UPI0018CB939F|nr:hypothetical protein [Cryobacterium sp. CAN_C3]MEC5154730.1 hypothetical protein [Cryobacterium sp. CAN_C3]
MAKTLTHQFIKTGIDAVRSDPGLWGTRPAGIFLATAETDLTGLARKLGIEPADALSETWMLWRKTTTTSDDLAARTITHVSAEFGRELKAARALTSSADSPYHELLNFQKQLTTAARGRAERRGDPTCPTVNVTAYSDHDDFFAQQSTDMMVPGDDRHAELLDAQWPPMDGEFLDDESLDDRRSDALTAGLDACREILRGIIDDGSIDILLDGIATRVSVSGHGGDTNVAKSVAVVDMGTDVDDVRRSAVGSAAETLVKDRPLKGGPHDTLAGLANVSPEVVRLTVRLLLGSKTPARPLTSKRAAEINGGVPVRKEPVVLRGVPQLIADGMDPWKQPHIVNTVNRLKALVAG